MTKHKNKTYFIRIIFAAMMFVFVVHQTQAVDQGSFELHLYYSNGETVYLEDGGYISASSVPFVAPAASVRFGYVVKLYDNRNQLLTSATVDSRGDNPGLEEREFIIRVPFDRKTARIELLNSSGSDILRGDGTLVYENFCNRNKICEAELNESSSNCTIDCPLAQTGQCNNNGICENTSGENWFTCLTDCPIPNESGEPTPTPQGGGAGSIVGAILYIIGGLALAIIVWFIRKSRNNQPS